MGDTYLEGVSGPAMHVIDHTHKNKLGDSSRDWGRCWPTMHAVEEGSDSCAQGAFWMEI